MLHQDGFMHEKWKLLRYTWEYNGIKDMLPKDKMSPYDKGRYGTQGYGVAHTKDTKPLWRYNNAIKPSSQP